MEETVTITADENGYQPTKIEDQDATAFNEALKQATEQKLAIEHDSKARTAELAKEFAEFMLDRVSPEFRDQIAEKLGLYAKVDPGLKEDKRQKKRNAALYSFFKSSFNKSVDLILHKDDQWPRENSASKVRALVKSIYATLWFAQNDPEVAQMIRRMGIEVRFNAPVDTISDDDPNTEGDRIARKQILDAGVEAQKQTIEQNLAIEENLYPQVPQALRYDAESNPKGIKKGQFTSLASVTAKKQQLEQDGQDEKAKALIQKTSENFFYGSVNQKLLFDTYQQVQ